MPSVKSCTRVERRHLWGRRWSSSYAWKGESRSGVSERISKAHRRRPDPGHARWDGRTRHGGDL